MPNSSENKIKQEINSILDDLDKRNEIWSPRWVAHMIVNSHKDGIRNGAHADFWNHCGYSKAREMVTRCINRRAGVSKETISKQFILPGYEHAQSHYVVTRNNDEVGVPIHQCSDEELSLKANTYRKMGVACFAHADELVRYISARQSKCRSRKIEGFKS